MKPLTTNDVTVQNGVASDFTARKEINVQTEFHAVNGSEVHIYPSETFSDCDDYTGFARVAGNSSLPENAINSFKEIELWFNKNEEEFLEAEIIPNPNNGFFTLILNNALKEKSVNVKIKNILGEHLKEISNLGNEIIIDASKLSKGIYFLEINAVKKTITKKLIIN